ncbi:hypothetical protein ZWY2020_017300 [Hordeum vulgare]|nr:hypothetical protein ZWY2020_017300 [Hordeum vulgare]
MSRSAAASAMARVASLATSHLGLNTKVSEPVLPRPSIASSRRVFGRPLLPLRVRVGLVPPIAAPRLDHCSLWSQLCRHACRICHVSPRPRLHCPALDAPRPAPASSICTALLRLPRHRMCPCWFRRRSARIICLCHCASPCSTATLVGSPSRSSRARCFSAACRASRLSPAASALARLASPFLFKAAVPPRDNMLLRAAAFISTRMWLRVLHPHPPRKPPISYRSLNTLLISAVGSSGNIVKITPSDGLAVEFLERECRIKRPLRVNPLFEKLDVFSAAWIGSRASRRS